MDGDCKYVAGRTLSADFPTTDGTINDSQFGDIFLQKYTNGMLTYSTVLGDGDRFSQLEGFSFDGSNLNLLINEFNNSDPNTMTYYQLDAATGVEQCSVSFPSGAQDGSSILSDGGQVYLSIKTDD